MKQWWQRWQHRRAERFLTRHPALTEQILRQYPDVAGRAVEGYFAARPARLDAAQDPGRRTTVWPVLNQLGVGGSRVVVQNLPKVTPFNLRKFSETPPARRAINAVSNPILGMDWTVEPIPNPDAALGDENKPTPDQHRRILATYQMLTYPNNEDSWRQLLEQTLEDIIVGGFGCWEVATTAQADRPAFLWPVDGMSIRINADWRGQQSEPRYSQSLGYIGMSVGAEDMVTLRDEQLIYMRLNPRTSTPFGFGYLETAFASVNAFLGAFEYATKRASNETPSYAIFLGENYQPAQVQQFRFYWENEIEGTGKIPIFGGGRAPQAIDFRGSQSADPLYIAWQEHIIRIIALSFGLSPFKLGLERDVNRSTAETQASDDWETVAPVANTLADYVTHGLLHKRLGWPDLRFRWIVTDSDEKRQMEILELEYTTNSITVNELRKVRGRPPLAPDVGDLTKTEYEAAAEARQLPKNPLEAEPGFGGPPAREELAAQHVGDPARVQQLYEHAQALVLQNGVAH